MAIKEIIEVILLGLYLIFLFVFCLYEIHKQEKESKKFRERVLHSLDRLLACKECENGRW